MEGGDVEFVEALQSNEVRSRLDPRSGKRVLMQPESFWRDHEIRRKASGASVADYCEANELARSTFQRWVSRLAGRGARGPGVSRDLARQMAPAAGFAPMPIHSPVLSTSAKVARSAPIEIDGAGGMTVRLYDEAAHRAIELILSRLREAR